MGIRPIMVTTVTAILGSTALSACGMPTSAKSLPPTVSQSVCRQLDQQQVERASAGGYAYFYDNSLLVKALQSSDNKLLRGIGSEVGSASNSNNTTLFNAAVEAGRAVCR